MLSTAERHAVTDQLEQYTAGGGRLVVALRGDYYGRLAELPSLAAYAGAASVLVGPMRDDELRRVVVEPAERVGLAVDDDLLEAVLDDVAGQPAALPMLSTALVRTWENRAERRLTLAGYRSGGGVALAVEATAEEAYLALDETGRTAVRRLLLRLAGREGDAWVRRPIRRSDVPTETRLPPRWEAHGGPLGVCRTGADRDDPRRVSRGVAAPTRVAGGARGRSGTARSSDGHDRRVV